ncbi:hypothetical protein B0H19DRAFT_1190500 [Mycena capillaripes]|nr:hypothetical protein B0H19DRAFT_1190500 [Mycena capillaripes]
MLFASPHDGRMLKDLSAPKFINAAEQLFNAILDAFRRRVLHRDISINNILLADTQLLLVDWEIGRRFEEVLSADMPRTITGTLDTMSVASLEKNYPLPHDDIESAVYVLLKVLTQAFVPSPEQKLQWAKVLQSYCWDDPTVDPTLLANTRKYLWDDEPTETSKIPRTVDIFESDGHQARAQLILSLLSLPLPAKRWGPNSRPTRRTGINCSDYEAILSSLEDLVKKAVDAVHSVNVNSFIGS